MSRPSNRNAIFAAFARGDSPATIVAALGITKQAVSEWKKKWELEKSTVNVSIDQSTVHPHGSLIEAAPESLGTMERPGLKDQSLDAPSTRPLSWKEKVAIAVQAIAESGASRNAAFSIASIPRSTGYLKMQQDPEFREAILAAEARMELGPARNLKRLAEGNQQGAAIAAAIFLGRRLPHDWAERRQVSVDVSGRIESIDIRAILVNATPEDLAAISRTEARLQELEGQARSLPEHVIDAEIVGERGDLP